MAESQDRFAAMSLEELIAGHAGGTVDIVERALSLGWDLGRPRAVLLASIDPPTEGKLTALGTIAAAARATLGRDAIVWTRSTTVAALVTRTPTIQSSDGASPKGCATNSTSGSGPSP